jgi:hypothetical protein
MYEFVEGVAIRVSAILTAGFIAWICVHVCGYRIKVEKRDDP